MTKLTAVEVAQDGWSSGGDCRTMVESGNGDTQARFLFGAIDRRDATIAALESELAERGADGDCAGCVHEHKLQDGFCQECSRMECGADLYEDQS